MKQDQTRALQIGFLLLLVLSSAQVAWWVYENSVHSNNNADRLVELHEASANAVTAALSGASPAQVDTTLRHITVDPDTGRAIVDPNTIAIIRDEAHRRTNRFYWEGGFFLLVLILGMSGLTATIRRDGQLRRRQQNFLASVSHEFKSPLASIQLTAETLNRRSTDEETRRWGTRILVDCERLLRTVDNLLNTNRLDEGTLKVLPETIVLRNIAMAIEDEFAERMRHYGISMSVGGDDSISLHTDVTALETILRNLVDNSLKACVASDGNLIEIGISEDANIVTLSVKDNGVGFDPADRKMLFEKFYRVGNEQQRTTPGTGLGLYIVHRLAKLSGASVTADSKGHGHGAIITVKWSNERNQ